MSAALRLRLLPDRLAVCRLAPEAELPSWFPRSASLTSITRTPEELSLLVPERSAPEEVRAERGFRALVVEGPLDFALVGVLADLTGALARAAISVFAFSTFDTDYLLVKEDRLAEAVRALGRAGHEVEER